MSAEQAEWLRNEMRSAQNMSARYKLGSKDREAWSAKAEKFRDAAAHIESLETRIEAMSESLRVIAAGSGYEWSETREHLHRIIDANVECAQNALAVLTGAQHERS